jgi:hypothetical protein
MSQIVHFDKIIADFFRNRPMPSKCCPLKRGSFISDQRFAEAKRNYEEYINIEYWKIENLTKEEREQFSKLVGENFEHYIAKMSVMAARLFIGTLMINGRSIVIGDWAYLRQSDIDWWVLIIISSFYLPIPPQYFHRLF